MFSLNYVRVYLAAVAFPLLVFGLSRLLLCLLECDARSNYWIVAVAATLASIGFLTLALTMRWIDIRGRQATEYAILIGFVAIASSMLAWLIVSTRRMLGCWVVVDYQCGQNDSDNARVNVRV